MVCVSSSWSNQLEPLAAGDELFVSYEYMADDSRLTCFLTYGFVPSELLPTSTFFDGVKL